MPAWRTPKGLLVDLGPTRVPVVSDLADDLPEGPWRELHEFQLLDPDGKVLQRFPVSVWSLDDDLGICVHAVVEGALRELTLIQHYGSVWRVRKEERVVLGDLVAT